MARKVAAVSEWVQRPTTSLLIHAFVVGVVLTLHGSSDAPTIPLYAGGVLVFLTYLLLATLEASRSKLVITPLSFYFLWYAVALGVAPVHAAMKISSGKEIDFSTAFIPPEYLARGYITFLLGSLALHVGIQLVRPKGSSDSRSPLLSRRRADTILLIIWATSIAVRIGASSVSSLGSLRGLLSYGSLAAISLHALGGTDPNQRTRRYFELLLLGVLIELLMSARDGSKGYIMFSFIPLVWPVLAMARLRWLLVPFAVALSSLYLYVVQPVITTSRLVQPQQGDNTLSHMLSVYQTGDYVEESDTLARFLDRVFEPLPIGFIHADVERFGFRNGETLDYLAYAFIPRFIWPEKPWVTRGAWFTMYLGAANSEESATSSTGISAPGELFWNFGFPGVIAGMLCLGMLISAQWRIAGAAPTAHPVRFLLYVSLVISMTEMAEFGTAIVAGVVRMLLVLVLLVVVGIRGARHLDTRVVPA